MPVDSLLDMACRACIRYSARITDIGDLDYDLIRPVLLKIESPEKLVRLSCGIALVRHHANELTFQQHQLEQQSPQIIGKDAEIWLGFIKRDIPDWNLKPHEPKDPKNWWKVYRKLKEEAREASTANEAILKAALANIKSEKEQNTVEIASSARSRDLAVARPSRRARIHYNYVSGRAGSKGANKMTLMERIRKEARDAKVSKMNRPMHELQKRATTVKEAPQRFVEDLKQKAAKAVSPPLNKATAIPLIQTLRTRKGDGRGSTVKSQTVREKNGDGQLTVDFLEDSDDPPEEGEEPPRKLLKVDNDERSRSLSPMKLAPQQHALKRRQAPSLFMSSPKKIPRPPLRS